MFIFVVTIINVEAFEQMLLYTYCIGYMFEKYFVHICRWLLKTKKISRRDKIITYIFNF